MKALSIRQPWAWAILHAGKRHENRSWSTRYRGPILIHASKGLTRAEYDDCADTFNLINTMYDVALALPPLSDLERGGIVGRGVIVDCVSKSNNAWFFGPYAFVLDQVEPLPFHPCKGALGFFDVEMPT